jgi:hypothetical protein
MKRVEGMKGEKQRVVGKSYILELKKRKVY